MKFIFHTSLTNILVLVLSIRVIYMTTMLKKKKETFFLCIDNNAVKMIPVYTDLQKGLKTLCYACQVSS